MRLRQVEFLGAIATPDQSPPLRLPHVAIAGRSNVGKSRLINALLGRKRLARVSKRPGKTREINLYRVNDFVLADLPGYGYARVPAQVRAGWGELIEGYLTHTPELRGIVLLIDARRGAAPDDRRMVEYIAHAGTPALVVLTKIDKLPRSERGALVRQVGEELGVPEDQVVATSARTREGVSTLLDSIDALVRSDTRGEP